MTRTMCALVDNPPQSNEETRAVLPSVRAYQIACSPRLVDQMLRCIELARREPHPELSAELEKLDSIESLDLESIREARQALEAVFSLLAAEERAR